MTCQSYRLTLSSKIIYFGYIRVSLICEKYLERKGGEAVSKSDN
jgi:hypothetical protein